MWSAVSSVRQSSFRGMITVDPHILNSTRLDAGVHGGDQPTHPTYLPTHHTYRPSYLSYLPPSLPTYPPKHTDVVASITHLDAGVQHIHTTHLPTYPPCLYTHRQIQTCQRTWMRACTAGRCRMLWIWSGSIPMGKTPVFFCVGLLGVCVWGG